jgi:hypothetical protein
MNIFDKDFDGLRPPKLKEVVAEITICNDIEKLLGKVSYKSYFQKRFFEFIEDINVEVNEYSMFTILLLHEIGHSHLIKLFLDVGMEKEFDNLYQMAKTTVRVTGSFKQEQLWVKTHKISLGQTCDLQENFADAYALKNFPKVWKSVKQFVRPELTNKSTTIISRFHKRFTDADKKYITKMANDSIYGNLFKELFA